MPFTLEPIIERLQKPLTIAPNESVQHALELMKKHDFSQLPVVGSDDKPIGLITSESILRAITNLGVIVEKLRVIDAMIKVGRKFRPGDNLFDLLDDLRDSRAVLVVDNDDCLVGIVTDYDAMEYFRLHTQDMMLVEDIESSLKDYILSEFINEAGEINTSALQTAIAACTNGRIELRKHFPTVLGHYLVLQGGNGGSVNKALVDEAFSRAFGNDSPKPFDKLTFAEYMELLLSKSQWPLYSAHFAPVEAITIRNLLNEVREIRNTLAHFRGEITSDQQERLKFCADWFEHHRIANPPALREVSTPLTVPHVPQEDTLEPAEELDLLLNGKVDPGRSRYFPLALYLQSKAREHEVIKLTFRQIEEIIGDDLPPSARQHRSFWANDSVGHSQSREWLDVGWRVLNVNMNDELVLFARIKEREQAYIHFFTSLLKELRARATFVVRNVIPQGRSWITIAGLPKQGGQVSQVNLAFGRGNEFRVGLYIDSGDKDINKRVYDYLYQHRQAIEDGVGKALPIWARLDDLRASYFALSRPIGITASEEELSSLCTWAVDATIRFYEVIESYVTEAVRQAKE